MAQRVVLLGHPVSHSLSEALLKAAFAAGGIDATYEPIDTPTVELAEAIDALRGDEYLGANIGVPHKERVVPMLDRLTDEAQKTGAVDTITRDGSQLVGHNTEVLGFKAALDALVGNQKMPKTAVVLGAGGGARAVVYSLIAAGFLNVVVFNRHLHRAERLVKHFARSASHMDLKAKPWHESVIEAELAKTDILINASSVGREPEESPLPAELLPPDLLVLDLHCVPEETRLLQGRQGGRCDPRPERRRHARRPERRRLQAVDRPGGPGGCHPHQLATSRNEPDVPVEPAGAAGESSGGAARRRDASRPGMIDRDLGTVGWPTIGAWRPSGASPSRRSWPPAG